MPGRANRCDGPGERPHHPRFICGEDGLLLDACCSGAPKTVVDLSQN